MNTSAFKPGDMVRLVDDAAVEGRKRKRLTMPPTDRALVVLRVTDSGRFLGVKGWPGYWSVTRFEAWSE